MRYSTFTASLLVSTASAWRLPDFAHQGWGPINSSTAAIAPSKTAAASVTHVATSVAASIAPTTTAVASAAATAVAGLTSDEQNALDAQNDARAAVGTADFSWDDSLAAEALAYAKTLASSGTFQHSGVSGEGENLYMQSGSSTPLTNAVKSWVSEKSAYSGQAITSTNYMTFGHYTQVVWKDTTKVGMGVATGSSGTYVVARYKAPGNFIGEKAY